MIELDIADTNLELLGSLLGTLGRFWPSRGRLVIGLTARPVSGAELLFLLVEPAAAAIPPVARLFACPTSLGPRSLAAFLRLGTNGIAGFIAGAGRVQHADYCSHTATRQEPQKAVAFTIRHNSLLVFSVYRMVAPRYVKDNSGLVV